MKFANQTPQYGLVELVAVILGLLSICGVQGQIYVAQSGAHSVGEYNVNGTTINASLIKTGYDTLAISGNHLYTGDGYHNTVGEYTTSGVTVNASLITGLSVLVPYYSMAISGSTLYISVGNAVSTYSLTGTLINPSFLTGASYGDIFISGNNLFVVSGGDGYYANIAEYNATTGALINSSVVSGLYDLSGFAVSGNYIYASSYADGTVTKYTTSGAYVATLVSGLGDSGAANVTVAGNDVFVSDVIGNTVNIYNATTGAAVVPPIQLPFGADPNGIVVEFPAWTGASTATWAGANWSPAGAPGSGNTAIFNASSATVNGNTTIDLGTGVTVANIFIDTSDAAAYTFGKGAAGSQTLTLNGGGGITVNSTVANNELFNSTIRLGTDATAQTYVLNNYSTSNSLTLAGNLSGSYGDTAGVETLLVNSAGTTSISGIIADGGATSLALSESGAGILNLSGANTYSGGTTVTNGTININGVGALGVGSGGLTLNGGTLQYAPSSSNTDLSIGDQITLAASGGTIDTNGNNVTFANSIGNGGAGSLTVVDSSGGTKGSLILDGANIYSGGTMINSGTLVAGNSSAVGTGDVTLNGGTLATTPSNQVLNVGGSFSQTGGTLRVNVNQPVQGASYHALAITGTAALDGTLEVNVTGYTPGETFSFVLTADLISGSFANVINDQSGIITVSKVFSGDNKTLTVTEMALPPIDFGQWETNNHIANSPAATTLENDGVPNLLKYLADITPNVPMSATDWAALPSVGTTTSGGTPYLTLTYRQYALESGITVNVQTSADLLTWTTLTLTTTTPTTTTYTLQQVNTDPNTGDPIMRVQVPASGTSKFIRLSVTQP